MKTENEMGCVLSQGVSLGRLRKESAKAYHAFKTYVEMGPDRSLSQLARALDKPQPWLEEWSSKYGWQDRIREHERHLARVEQAEAEALVKAAAVDWVTRQEEQRLEEWKVRNELLEAAREALNRWWGQKHRVPSFEGIARMLDLATRLGRLASGMPTDRTETKKQVSMEVDLEFEAALAKAYPDVVDVETVKPAELKEVNQ